MSRECAGFCTISFKRDADKGNSRAYTYLIDEDIFNKLVVYKTDELENGTPHLYNILNEGDYDYHMAEVSLVDFGRKLDLNPNINYVFLKDIVIAEPKEGE